MTQLFSKANDSLLRLVLAGGLVLICATIGSMLVLARSPYMTNQGSYVAQPVPFSHEHHVGDIGIDCRFCHQSVETSAVAGVPSASVCIKCHNQLWSQADMLEPIRASFHEEKPLRWNRVHDLPDYVYFNHSIHLSKGVGCFSCHGRVDEMPLMRQEHSLEMKWCLECHRSPTKHLRPQQFLFEPRPLNELIPEDEIHQVQLDVANAGHVISRVDCYTCHR